MNVNGTAMGGPSLFVKLLQAGACENEPILLIGSVWKMDPRLAAAARQRIRLRSIATVHAVATVKFDRSMRSRAAV
jgi:hypothetical protein